MALFCVGETSKSPAKDFAEDPDGNTAEALIKISSITGAEHRKLRSTELIGSAWTQEDHLTHASSYRSFMKVHSHGNFSGKADLHGSINGRKIDGEIKKIGLGREFAETEDGQMWTRKADKPWTKLDMNAQKLNIEPVILAVVRKRQIEKADHWCLFVGKEGSPGNIYQVIGDHLYMLYDAKENVNIFASTSFRDAYTIQSDMNEHQQARIAQLARNTSLPRAPNPREIAENCQTWVLKVLWQLQKEDIISESNIYVIQSLLSRT